MFLGGHTTEILRLVGSLSSAYSPRDYVIADSDEMSAKKIVSFEDARKRDSATEVRDHFYKLQVVHQVQLSLKRIPWYFNALPTIGNKM